MPTTRPHITTTDWTNLSNGPLVVGLDRGRVWFDTGDTAPTNQRSGYLHEAQGQMRLVNFTRETEIWARAVDSDTRVVVITGTLSRAQAAGIIVRTYGELVDPGSVVAGTSALVTDDPNDNLNGHHVALGNTPGLPARYWGAA